MPWPFKNREIFVELTGLYIEDLGILGMTGESVLNEEYFGRKMKRNIAKDEMIQKQSFTYLKPLSAERTLVRSILYQNP